MVQISDQYKAVPAEIGGAANIAPPIRRNQLFGCTGGAFDRVRSDPDGIAAIAAADAPRRYRRALSFENSLVEWRLTNEMTRPSM